MRIGDTVIVKDTGRRALITAVLPENHFQVEYLPDPAEDPIDRDSAIAADEGGVYFGDELQLVTSRSEGAARMNDRYSRSSTANRFGSDARPLVGQRAPEMQAFGTITSLPNGLETERLGAIVDELNQLLADTMTLRDLYKKHHWQVVGPTFYQLHLLFDKHYDEQVELVDKLAERIQLLGGLSIAMAPDVAETTRIERPPRGREEVRVQLSRLLEADELILTFAHRAARRAQDAGDDGTNDLLVSDLIRTNELQVWFLAEHLVDVPLVHASQ